MAEKPLRKFATTESFKAHLMVQLSKWVRGETVHDYETNMCTPDFACCTPELLAPLEARIGFYNAFVQSNHVNAAAFFALFESAFYIANGRMDLEAETNVKFGQA